MNLLTHSAWPLAPRRSRSRRSTLLRDALLRAALAGACAVAALAVQAQTPAAQQTPNPTAAQAKAATTPLACLIEPSRVVHVGSPVVGVIDSVAVERGDPVKVGQILATLKRDVERASAGAARTRSEAQAELHAAQSAAELARAKFARAQELRQQNFISEIALEQARSEAEVAKRRVDAAREQQLVSAQDASTAQTQVKLRELTATVDGVVMDRYLHPGERVDDRPILRIAQINPLRVELILPLAAMGSLHEGDRVAVWPEYPGAAKAMATVERVDRVVDAASRTFRARLALPNPGSLIVAGVRCKADVAGAVTGAVAGAVTGAVAGAVTGAVAAKAAAPNNVPNNVPNNAPTATPAVHSTPPKPAAAPAPAKPSPVAATMLRTPG
jgi:membrane fusion protein, heavy metal efflux system